MRVRSLLLLLPLAGLVACTGPEVSPQPGLTYDRYIVPAVDLLPDPQSPDERARAEVEWPPVGSLSQPWRIDVRRVNTLARGLAPQPPSVLPECGTPQAKSGPCRGVPTPPPALIPGDRAVILRAQESGYGAPRLTLTGQ